MYFSGLVLSDSRLICCSCRRKAFLIIYTICRPKGHFSGDLASLYSGLLKPLLMAFHVPIHSLDYL